MKNAGLTFYYFLFSINVDSRSALSQGVGLKA